MSRMTLQFLGTEPCEGGDCPTIWTDGNDYVIQGLRISQATLDEIGRVPEHETVVRIPKTLMQYLPEVTGDRSSTSA